MDTQTIKVWRRTYRILKVGAAVLNISMSALLDLALTHYLQAQGVEKMVVSSMDKAKVQAT